MSIFSCCCTCRKPSPAPTYERSRTIRPNPKAEQVALQEVKTSIAAHERFASTEMVSIRTALHSDPSKTAPTPTS